VYKRNHSRGFTLIELTLVMVLIGIVAAMGAYTAVRPAFVERHTVLSSVVLIIQHARQRASNAECDMTVSIRHQQAVISPSVACSNGDRHVHAIAMKGGRFVEEIPRLTLSPLGVLTPKGIKIQLYDSGYSSLILDNLQIQ